LYVENINFSFIYSTKLTATHDSGEIQIPIIFGNDIKKLIVTTIKTINTIALSVNYSHLKEEASLLTQEHRNS